MNCAGILKVVSKLGVGSDNIDLQTCKDRSVKVAPATAANSVSVAEYLMGAIFTLYCPITSCFDAVNNGQWSCSQMIGHEIAGKTLWLVGMGDTANELGKRAVIFGMHVIFNDSIMPLAALQMIRK